MRPLATEKLVIHDAKPVLEWWLEYETTQRPSSRTVPWPAYLLNAGRATYSSTRSAWRPSRSVRPRCRRRRPPSTAAAVPPPPQCPRVRARGGRARSAPHADGACAAAHALTGARGAELDDKALRRHLRRDRAASRARARADGAPPASPSTRAFSEVFGQRSWSGTSITSRGKIYQLAGEISPSGRPAAGADPVREAEAPHPAPHEDRLLDGCRRAHRAGRGHPLARQVPGASQPLEAEGHVRGHAALLINRPRAIHTTFTSWWPPRDASARRIRT